MEVLNAKPYLGAYRGQEVPLHWDGERVSCELPDVQRILDRLYEQLDAGDPIQPPAYDCPDEASAYRPTSRVGLAWFLMARFELPADLQAELPTMAPPEPLLTY